MGLLRKGVGLCHGIAGNAYALIVAGEVDKFHCFVEFMLDHVDSLKNSPDRPFSLYEGLAGAVCLLSDVIALSEGTIKASTSNFQPITMSRGENDRGICQSC